MTTNLNWTIQYGHLVAEAEGCHFDVEQTAEGWLAQVQLFKKMPLGTYTMRNRSPVSPSLQAALSWCDLQLKIWLAPPGSPKPFEEAPKFPSTLDAAVWASRCTAWFGAFKVPDLAEWFQAALSHGYDEGVQTCIREGLPNGEPGPARTMTASQYLAWKQTNVPPPSAQAPEPPSVEERLAALEERVKWSPDSRLVEERLKELEAKLEDTHANLKVVQAVGERTETDLDMLCRERARIYHGLDAAIERIEKLEART